MAFLFGAHPASAAACANEAIREEQGPVTAALPECRAYELVSPESIPSTGNTGAVSVGARAADDGDAFAYFSLYPFQGATSSGRFYRARRGEAGWTVEGMVPQTVPGGVNVRVLCEDTGVQYSEGLSSSLLSIGFEIKEAVPGESFCPEPEQQLVAGEPKGFRNLLLRADPASPYQLVNSTPSGVDPANAQFQDASRDLSHVVFGEEAELTPEAPPGYDLYEWNDGTDRLVTFLPDGSAARGDLVGAVPHERPSPTGGQELRGGTDPGTATLTNAVSADGETVFFYANGNLFVRKHASRAPTASGRCSSLEPEQACTAEVDGSRGVGLSGGGIFQYASADGTRVFFTDESKLAAGSTASTGKPDLYEFNVTTGGVKDLTISSPGSANVRAFSGAAEDGSRIYFMAKGVLSGAGQNADGESAQAAEPNLYVAEGGAVAFIATVDASGESGAWSNDLELRAGEVPRPQASVALATANSPSGQYFAFNSSRGLGGIPSGSRQIYLFDAVSRTLVCASCLPGGTAPAGSSRIADAKKTAEFLTQTYLPRALTDSGQLFFSTDQALLPADTDGVSDVYEFRAGVGLRLLSDGTGTEPSYFFDASEGGKDVFFGTADALVRADTDNAFNLYDARVDGGFPEPPPAPATCGAVETCHDPGTSPPRGRTPGTSTETGPGNVGAVKVCKHGTVKRGARCAKRPKHHEKGVRRHRKKGADR